MEPTKTLVKSSLERTNAHGLARLVSEKRLYIRVLWLLAWLACCGAFLRSFAGFAARLRDNEVTSSFQSSAVPFEFPDLYFCFDSPLSGSRPLVLNESAAGAVNATFKMVTATMDSLCDGLTKSECDYMYEYELPMMSINTMPYSFIVNQMGHIMSQSVLNASIVRTSGMIYKYQNLRVTQFYHPSNLRCFQVALNDTERRELQLTGPNKSLYFQLMLDSSDSRMGQAALPKLDTPAGSLTASYWALDKDTLYWPDRWSAARLYITEPGHYPSNFDTTVTLEAGRSYNVQLKMSEEVHKEDPSRCVDQHADVQIVNPYDNSAYTVAYDYAYCYNSAVQALFKREVNVTCAFLPHPWPPADRSLYNLSSGWGSVQDVKKFLTGKERIDLDGLLTAECENAYRCTERSYTAAVNSVLWPSPDSLRSFLRDLDFPKELDQLLEVPALHNLKRLATDPNSTELAAEFVRANFLQLQMTVDSPKADRTVFNRAYSFESFVADVGGILGIYLGMSVLTTCEIMQFVHDLVLICFARSSKESSNIEKRTTAGDRVSVNIEAKEFQL